MIEHLGQQFGTTHRGKQGKKRLLSRRTVIIGIAGLTGLATVGGGLWWIRSLHLLYIYRGHSSSSVFAVGWSPDGTRIASASADETVQVWDATSGGHAFTYRGHSDGVWTVAWSPDGTLLASGGNDGTVQVWQAP